jgi:hypothetical protein
LAEKVDNLIREKASRLLFNGDDIVFEPDLTQPPKIDKDRVILYSNGKLLSKSLGRNNTYFLPSYLNMEKTANEDVQV